MRLLGKMTLGCLCALLPAFAYGQSSGGVRIGVMSDSSSVYSAIGGPGSFLAAPLQRGFHRARRSGVPSA